eukprot:scaffold107726_cov60-Phaeocystis_antarctica.AAC.1
MAAAAMALSAMAISAAVTAAWSVGVAAAAACQGTTRRVPLAGCRLLCRISTWIWWRRHLRYAASSAQPNSPPPSSPPPMSAPKNSVSSPAPPLSPAPSPSASSPPATSEPLLAVGGMMPPGGMGGRAALRRPPCVE